FWAWAPVGTLRAAASDCTRKIAAPISPIRTDGDIVRRLRTRDLVIEKDMSSFCSDAESFGRSGALFRRLKVLDSLEWYSGVSSWVILPVQEAGIEQSALK